jgi:hypothetical protein
MNNDFNNKLPPLPINLNKAFVIENNNNTHSNNNKKIIHLTNGFANKYVNSNTSNNKFIINIPHVNNHINNPINNPHVNNHLYKPNINILPTISNSSVSIQPVFNNQNNKILNNENNNKRRSLDEIEIKVCFMIYR